jgi:CHASE1-domain containing sensor protein
MDGVSVGELLAQGGLIAVVIGFNIWFTIHFITTFLPNVFAAHREELLQKRKDFTEALALQAEKFSQSLDRQQTLFAETIARFDAKSADTLVLRDRMHEVEKSIERIEKNSHHKG